MKKYLLVLLAVVMCGSTGCDTDIDSSNIASLINDENRCAITGGIQITSEQANVIQSMITVINTNDCWDNKTSGNEILKTTCPPLSDFKTKLSQAGNSYSDIYKDALVTIKHSLKGAFLEYHSKTMVDIFEFVSLNVSMETSKELYYCACNYEFCDDNTACVTDSITQLPTCAVSKYASSANENQCDPIKLNGETIIDILSNSTLPIVKKLEEINKAGTNIDLNDAVFSNWCILNYQNVKIPNPDTNNIKDKQNDFIEHCKAPNGYGYLFSNTCDSEELKDIQGNCKLAQSLFSYLFNCLNANDPVLCPQEKYSPLIVPGFNDVNYSATYYNLIRGYVEEMLTTNLEETLQNNGITIAEFKSSKEFVHAVDEFIINEAVYIVNAPGNIYNIKVNNVVTVADFLNATNEDGSFCTQGCSINLQQEDILTGVRKVLDTLYSNSNPISIPYKKSATETVNIQTTMPDNEMRRKLFAYIPLGVMPKDTLASPLTTNLQCVSVPSAIGDPAGIKKYCEADNNQIIGAEQIFDAINGDNLIPRVDLFDAIIMGTDAQFKVKLKNSSNETADVAIHAGSTSNIISFTLPQNGNKPEYLKGKWNALKCPSGASCSSDTSCGVCADTSIPHTIMAYDTSENKYSSYKEATCKNGAVITKAGTSASTDNSETPAPEEK